MKQWLLSLAVVALVTPAAAQGLATYKDAANRFSFQYPADWPIDPPKQERPGLTVVVVGGADADCMIASYDRPEWADGKASDVQRTFKNPIKTSDYLASFNGFMQTEGAAEPSQVRVETVKGWPVHMADLPTPSNSAVAAIHYRPGLEVRMTCKAYGSKDFSKDFQTVLTSFETPKDAEWSQQAADYAAAKAAAEAAAAEKAAAEAAAKAKASGNKKH